MVDVRGPRFGAWVTTVVLVVVLLTGNGWLLAAQAVVFAVGGLAGLRYAPYGLLFRALTTQRSRLREIAPALDVVPDKDRAKLAARIAALTS